ncbi:prepilin peptidase [Herminiimonas sp. CN]|uniref:A24 family peptidase n=1 Tax=Herminiimonas sp. CN TaxID=1349818 RepID=UPI0009DE157A|nr:A24 family peptidase [Herminiimonas sp. CN]
MNNLSPALIAAVAVSPLFVLVLAALWSDVKSHRIPNRLVFWGAGLGLLLNSVLPQGYGFISSLPGALGPWKALAGLGLGFCILLPMYALRAMAAGDVKLMAMIGAFLGPNAIVGTILMTFIVGGLLTLLVVVRNGSVRLLLGNLRTMLMVSFIKGTVLRQLPTVDAAPVTAGKLPYAVAIALGTFTYIALERAGQMQFLKFF